MRESGVSGAGVWRESGAREWGERCERVGWERGVREWDEFAKEWDEKVSGMFLIHIQHKHLTLYNSLVIKINIPQLIIHKVHIVANLDSSRTVKLVKIIWRISLSSVRSFNIQAYCRFNYKQCITSVININPIRICIYCFWYAKKGYWEEERLHFCVT